MESEKAKILIVEDDPYVRRVYQRLFEFSKYEVQQAATGTEGLEIARSKQPNLILLDLMLPTVSGLDVLKDLKSKKETKDIPVLVLTNLGEEQVMETALSLGADGYMVKADFTPEQVLEQVNKYFGGHPTKS